MLSQPFSYKGQLTNWSDYYSIEARGPLLDKVYSMRYRSYGRENYIDENVSEKFMDEFDAMPNCTSYLMYSEKKAVASIRSCVFTPEKEHVIPVMDIFSNEIGEGVGFDNPIIEANKFVVDPNFQKRGGIQARFSLFKNIADAIQRENAGCLLAAVRPAHVKFYKMLYFKPMSEVKSYPHLKFKTLLLACTDVEKFCDLVYTKSQSSGIHDAPILNHGTN